MALKVLFCSSEAVPFAKTGGLADVAGALPRALSALGHDVRLALPKYGAIDSKKIKSRKVASFDLPLSGRSTPVKVEASKAIPGVTTYLIDSPPHFERDGLYGHADDAERFAVFCRSAIEFIRRDSWKPDVIHANDWQSALIPTYLRTIYSQDQALSSIGVLYTIHNLAYQGTFEPQVLKDVGLDRSLFTVDGLEFYGKANFLKGGLIFADLLSTVSPTYSREIQTPEYGERLEGVLAKRRQDLFGVLNGIDYEEWDPATDEFLSAHYQAKDREGKAANKQALQQRLNLPARPEVPLLGIVSRLAGQKGLDLLTEVLPYLLRMDVQFVLLGTGEPYYHDVLSRLAEENPEKMAAVLAFDNALAHQIYSGSDFFLMPSHYEPCGLGQMISMRYGTIPVVRRTGGLADTVVEFDPNALTGNGFLMEQRSAVALFGAISRALLTMHSAPLWDRLVGNAMASDFSWERSAKAYGELYELAIERRRS